MEHFERNDEGYLRWLEMHPAGFVLNTQPGFPLSLTRLHRTRCSTIRGTPANGSTWTSNAYVKYCSTNLSQLETLFRSEIGKPVPRCGRCTP